MSALAEHAPSIPILLQDHADRTPRFWQRRKWRRALAAASAVAFCARDQALPFERAGLLHPRTASWPSRNPRRVSRRGTSERRRPDWNPRRPVLLWVGHLNENKSPLTVLRGLATIAAELPKLHLWLCFGAAPQLERGPPLPAQAPPHTRSRAPAGSSAPRPCRAPDARRRPLRARQPSRRQRLSR